MRGKLGVPVDLGFILELARIALIPAFAIDEAAQRMGVGRRRVPELVRGGHLRTLPVGCERRVPAVCILGYDLRQVA